jgi:NAD dependent epimerase/dehydratase family enzyme
VNRKIAISGASGLIGSKLTIWLQEQGDTVYRLVRQRGQGSSSVYWNYETGEIDAARLEGMDVVIHLAGKPLDEQRWTPDVKKAVYASRITGTTLISKTLAQLSIPPRLLISASATDYYADSETPIGEAGGRPGKGYLAEMCRDWEAATDSVRQAGIRIGGRRPQHLGGIPTVVQVRSWACLGNGQATDVLHLP